MTEIAAGFAVLIVLTGCGIVYAGLCAIVEGEGTGLVALLIGLVLMAGGFFNVLTADRLMFIEEGGKWELQEQPNGERVWTRAPVPEVEAK